MCIEGSYLVTPGGGGMGEGGESVSLLLVHTFPSFLKTQICLKATESSSGSSGSFWTWIRLTSINSFPTTDLPPKLLFLKVHAGFFFKHLFIKFLLEYS